MVGNGASRSLEQRGGIGFWPVFHQWHAAGIGGIAERSAGSEASPNGMVADHLREPERFAARSREPPFWISMRR